MFIRVAFTGLLLFKIAALLNVRERIKQCIHKPTEENGNDDWELYEEAALMREREAEMEREADLGGMALKEIDNESVNSIDSLPTYGL